MFDKSIKILHEFESALEIKDFFVEQGIKASKLVPNSCAISEYVKGNMPENSQVSTGGSTVSLFDGTTLICSLTNTHAMKSFIYHFDQGTYPELIK